MLLCCSLSLDQTTSQKLSMLSVVFTAECQTTSSSSSLNYIAVTVSLNRTLWFWGQWAQTAGVAHCMNVMIQLQRRDKLKIHSWRWTLTWVINITISVLCICSFIDVIIIIIIYYLIIDLCALFYVMFDTNYYMFWCKYYINFQYHFKSGSAFRF